MTSVPHIDGPVHVRVDGSALGVTTETSGGPLAVPARSYRRAPDALWRDSVRGLIVLAGTAEHPVLISGSGSVLWELLAAPSSVSELSQAVSDRWGIPLQSAHHAVTTVLEELTSLGAVSVQEVW